MIIVMHIINVPKERVKKMFFFFYIRTLCHVSKRREML